MKQLTRFKRILQLYDVSIKIIDDTDGLEYEIKLTNKINKNTEIFTGLWKDVIDNAYKHYCYERSHLEKEELVVTDTLIRHNPITFRNSKLPA